jgi:hypothetical protein
MTYHVANLWVAHASRALVGASRADELSLRVELAPYCDIVRKACFGETPKPARETRALPR